MTSEAGIEVGRDRMNSERFRGEGCFEAFFALMALEEVFTTAGTSEGAFGASAAAGGASAVDDFGRTILRAI